MPPAAREQLEEAKEGEKSSARQRLARKYPAVQKLSDFFSRVAAGCGRGEACPQDKKERKRGENFRDRITIRPEKNHSLPGKLGKDLRRGKGQAEQKSVAKAKCASIRPKLTGRRGELSACAVASYISPYQSEELLSLSLSVSLSLPLGPLQDTYTTHEECRSVSWSDPDDAETRTGPIHGQSKHHQFPSSDFLSSALQPGAGAGGRAVILSDYTDIDGGCSSLTLGSGRREWDLRYDFGTDGDAQKSCLAHFATETHVPGTRSQPATWWEKAFVIE